MITASILSFHSAKKVVSGKILFMPRSEKLQCASALCEPRQVSKRIEHSNSVSMLLCLLRKHEPSINEDVSVIDANQHAVHANLTQAPYWQDPKGRTLTRWGPRERSVWLPLQSRSQMFCAIALYKQATTLASALGL